MIVQLDFSNILTIWQNYLWANRQSLIETHSAMLYKKPEYDINNFKYKAVYYAYVVDNQIAGVNSGHFCTDDSYRSRGLFVFPQYRRKSIGTELLRETIKQGINEGAKFVWSLPRQTSWPTYQKAGFTLTSDWMPSETSENNAYCFFDCSSIKS